MAKKETATTRKFNLGRRWPKHLLFWFSNLLLVGLLFLFWNSKVLLPFKLFVVFLHESGHALAALLTGGNILSIEINPNQSGVTKFSGGNYFLALSGGYLGSTLFGCFFLLISGFRRIQRMIIFGLGLLILIMIVLYIRQPFTIVYCLLFGLFLIVVSMFMPELITTYFLRFLGFSSCMYALFDIRSDLLTLTQNPHTDAALLAQMTHIPAIGWAIAWSVISLILIYLAISFLIRLNRL